MNLCRNRVFHVVIGLVAGRDNSGSQLGFWCRNRGDFSLILRSVATKIFMSRQALSCWLGWCRDLRARQGA